MSTYEITLNPPNLMALKNSREIIYYYARIKLSNIDIEALRTDLLELAKNLSLVDQNANDVLIKASVALETRDIESALEDLDELSDGALNDYKRDLSNTLNTKKKTLTDLRNELSNPTFNLKQMSYANNTYRLQELGSTRANLQAISKQEGSEDYYDVMLKRKLALDTAIEAYEGVSFYDKTLPLLYQVDKVVTAAESPATFKKEMIKEGIQAAKHILKLVDSEVKHENMVTARIELIKQINTVEARAAEIDKQLKSNFHESQQIAAFEKLREPKAEYVAEVEKIIESFNTFISVAFARTDTKEMAQDFVKYAPTLKSYVSHLSPMWLRG